MKQRALCGQRKAFKEVLRKNVQPNFAFSLPLRRKLHPICCFLSSIMKKIPQLLHCATTLLLVMFMTFVAQAQHIVVNNPDIGHVEVAVNGDVSRLPILVLGSGDRLTISFDDLTPEYRRYTWNVEHCDLSWQPTEGLFESEALANAPQNEPIESYEQSSLTATLFTHYAFHLGGTGSNAVCPLVSGNYRVSVFSEEDKENPAFTIGFMVVENSAQLAVQATADTDIDYRRSHQQLNVTADVSSLRLINPSVETHLICVQNRSQFYTVKAPAPTYQLGNQLKWEHCRSLIFPAGNEYRKFEMPSTRIPGMHVDRIRFNDEVYTADLIAELPRRDYYYDEDQNGRSIIYTETSDNADTEADYVLTHFTLEAHNMETHPTIFVDGRWANGNAPYMMQYNPATDCYETDILLKQGYYSYRYLAIEEAEGRAVVYNVDGDYYQTENEYTLYLYYRPQGARYWHLAAFYDFNYKP